MFLWQNSFKDINKLDNLVNNLSKKLLRKKAVNKKDNSPKLKSLFNIEKSNILNSKYINLLKSLINDQLNKP